MIKINPTDEKFFRISDVLKEKTKDKKDDKKNTKAPKVRR